MKLLQWTLFIDMLGYRDINGAINTENSAMEFIHFMEMNKNIFDSQNNKFIEDNYKNSDQFNLYEFYDVKYAFVSDSFILTFYPLEVEMLTDSDKMYMHSANALFIIAMRLQTFIFNCFSEKGVFLRGGISNKYCFIKDSFAVGEGLIDAYKIESTIAVYPRIAFSPEVINNKKLMNKITYLSDRMYSGNQLIAIDPDDNVSFLDYLGFHLATVDTADSLIRSWVLKDREGFDAHFKTVEIFIRKHYLGIEIKLKELRARHSLLSEAERQGNERVIDKFEWLKKYHNSRICRNNILSNLVVS